MQSIPKTFRLESREDYEFLRENYPLEIWMDEYQKLLSTKDAWMLDGELADNDPGVRDETHKIEKSLDTTTGRIHRFQYSYRTNPHAKIYRMGFTEDEIKRTFNLTAFLRRTL